MKLRITIDSRTYEVEVEVADEIRPRAPHGYVIEPAALRIPAGSAAPGAPPPSEQSADEDKVCRSRVAGTVVKVVAQPGQAIQPGDTLLVLEAMKMETNITAPVAGKVRTVRVSAGEAVKSGQVVVELE